MKILNINYINNFFFLPFAIPFCFIIGPGVTDIFVSFISVLTLFYFFQNYKKIKDYYSYLFFFSIFYLLLITSSLISEYDVQNSLYRSIPYIRYFFFSIAISIFFSKIRHLSILINILLAIIGFLVLFAIFQILTNFNLVGEEIENSARLSSPFMDELIFGTLYAVFFLIILFFNKFSNSIIKMNGLLFTLFIIACLILIFISGERMIFFKTLLCLVLFLFLSKYSIKSKILVSIFSTLALIVVLVISPNLSNRYISEFLAKFSDTEITQTNIPTDTTVKQKKYSLENFLKSGHGMIFVSSFEIFKENPYFGVGTKQFREACKNYKYLKEKYNSSNSPCSTHPHNIYLEILSENGIFGFISFIILLMYIFFNNLNPILIRFQTSVPLIVFLWPIASTGSFFTNHTSSLFWFCLGLFMIKNILEVEKN